MFESRLGPFFSIFVLVYVYSILPRTRIIQFWNKFGDTRTIKWLCEQHDEMRQALICELHICGFGSVSFGKLLYISLCATVFISVLETIAAS